MKATNSRDTSETQRLDRNLRNRDTEKQNKSLNEVCQAEKLSGLILRAGGAVWGKGGDL